MNEYYELLGLSESATDEEITRRYEELKAKYKEDRWLDGEAGNEAAKMLTKLETAYREITASRKEQSKNTDGENTVCVIVGNGYYNQTVRMAEGTVTFGTPKLCYIIEKESFSHINQGDFYGYKRF